MTWDHNGKTRQQRGYGRQHERIREQLKREVIICEECRRKNPPQVRVGCVADHIIPLAKGGSGDRSNYQWLCRRCADDKDAIDRGEQPRAKLAPKYPRRRITTEGWLADD